MAMAALRLVLREAGNWIEVLSRLADGDTLGLPALSALTIGVPSTRVMARRLGPNQPDYARAAEALLEMAADAVQLDAIRYAPRFHDAMSQTLFGLLERGTRRPDHNHEALIERFVELEADRRPRTPRGLATAGLMAQAIAAFRGEEAEERELALRAAHDLSAAGLERHLRVTVARGWLPAFAVGWAA